MPSLEPVLPPPAYYLLSTGLFTIPPLTRLYLLPSPSIIFFSPKLLTIFQFILFSTLSTRPLIASLLSILPAHSTPGPCFTNLLSIFPIHHFICSPVSLLSFTRLTPLPPAIRPLSSTRPDHRFVHPRLRYSSIPFYICPLFSAH